MFKVLLALAGLVIGLLRREAEKLRVRAERREDAAEALYQASLRASDESVVVRKQAERVHRMAQKLEGALK